MHYLKSTIPSETLVSLAPTEPAPAALLRIAVKAAGYFGHSWSVLDARQCFCAEDACERHRDSAINGPLSMAQIQKLTFERDPGAWGSSISYPNLYRDAQGRYCYFHETNSSRYRIFIRQEEDGSMTVVIEIPTLLPHPEGKEGVKIEAIGCAVKILLSPSGEVISSESFIPPHFDGCGEWQQTPDKRWLVSPHGRAVQRTMRHHLTLATDVVGIFVKEWSFPEPFWAVAAACDHDQRDFESGFPF